MKKTIPASIVFIAMLVAASSGAATAADISLGLKAWANTWKENVKPGKGVARDLDGGSAMMAGPSLSARFSKDWIASVTYLQALDDYESQHWYEDGDKMKFERTDVDFMAGYLLRDPFNDLRFGFSVQYKIIEAPASYTNRTAGLDNVDAGTWKLRGPGLGVLLEKRLDESTLLYSNLGYLFLEQEFTFSNGGVSRFDAEGWALEVSVEHAFAKAISANLGVKYQRFKGEKANGDDMTDSFSGLTAGVAYTF